MQNPLDLRFLFGYNGIDIMGCKDISMDLVSILLEKISGYIMGCFVLPSIGDGMFTR